MEKERRRIEEREEKVRRECVEEVGRKEEEMMRRMEEVEDRERLWQEEKDEVNIKLIKGVGGKGGGW